MAVFKRYFLSDAANQAELLLAATAESSDCALSVVEQPPLDGTKIALWAYLQTDVQTRVLPNGLYEVKHGVYRQLWMGGSFNRAANSEYQMRLLLNDYAMQLMEEGCTLADNCLRTLLARIPRLKVLFTVSPIRHVRDGMHANQLSKATLLLAVNQLQATFPEHVFYFPAYELLLDELRDYRFYAEDMVHPSETAIRYVWERFTRSCISADALRIMEESENIRKMLSHKPFYPASEEYKRFLGQIVLKIDQLNGKYPYLDFQKEREICRIRLKA